jgi:hypothetical protein
MPANTGIIDGGDLLLYVETAGPVWTLIGESKSHSLSNKSEVRTRRTKSTGIYPGRKVFGLDATVNTDCLALYGTYGYWELLALQLARTKVKLKLAGRVTAGKGLAEQIGDKYLEATFVIDSVDLNANDGDDASYTASFSIDGDVSTAGLEIKTKSA